MNPNFVAEQTSTPAASTTQELSAVTPSPNAELLVERVLLGAVVAHRRLGKNIDGDIQISVRFSADERGAAGRLIENFNQLREGVDSCRSAMRDQIVNMVAALKEGGDGDVETSFSDLKECLSWFKKAVHEFAFNADFAPYANAEPFREALAELSLVERWVNKVEEANRACEYELEESREFIEEAAQNESTVAALDSANDADLGGIGEFLESAVTHETNASDVSVGNVGVMGAPGPSLSPLTKGPVSSEEDSEFEMDVRFLDDCFQEDESEEGNVLRSLSAHDVNLNVDGDTENEDLAKSVVFNPDSDDDLDLTNWGDVIELPDSDDVKIKDIGDEWFNRDSNPPRNLAGDSSDEIDLSGFDSSQEIDQVSDATRYLKASKESLGRDAKLIINVAPKLGIQHGILGNVLIDFMAKAEDLVIPKQPLAPEQLHEEMLILLEKGSTIISIFVNNLKGQIRKTFQNYDLAVSAYDTVRNFSDHMQIFCSNVVNTVSAEGKRKLTGDEFSGHRNEYFKTYQCQLDSLNRDTTVVRAAKETAEISAESYISLTDGLRAGQIGVTRQGMEKDAIKKQHDKYRIDNPNWAKLYNKYSASLTKAETGLAEELGNLYAWVRDVDSFRSEVIKREFRLQLDREHREIPGTEALFDSCYSDEPKLSELSQSLVSEYEKAFKAIYDHSAQGIFTVVRQLKSGPQSLTVREVRPGEVEIIVGITAEDPGRTLGYANSSFAGDLIEIFARSSEDDVVDNKLLPRCLQGSPRHFVLPDHAIELGREIRSIGR